MNTKRGVLIVILYTLTVGYMSAQERNQPKLVVPIGHTKPIKTAEFSPDGRQVLTVSNEDKTLKIWDTESGMLRHSLECDGDIRSAKFSTDGQRVVANCSFDEIKIWDAASGMLILSKKPKDNRYVIEERVTFVSPDALWIFITAEGGQGRLFFSEIQGPESYRRLPYFYYSFRGFKVFSPDSRRLVYTLNNRIIILDIESGKLLFSLNGSDYQNLGQFSPDGRYLVTTNKQSGKKTEIWDTESGKLLHRLKHLDTTVYSFTFSPDGSRLAMGCSDNTIKTWDTEIGKLLFSVNGKLPSDKSIVFSPYGRRLLTVSGDNSVTILDTESGKLLYNLVGHSSRINTAVFSPDGRLVLTASDDKSAKIWDARSGKLLHCLEGHSSGINTALFSPDGRRVVTASDDKSAKIWDVESGKLLNNLEGYSPHIKSTCVSLDGRLVMIASDRGEVNVWDTEGGKLLSTLKGNTDMSSVELSPDGRRLMAVYNYREVKIWEIESNKLLLSVKVDSCKLSSPKFSSDGRRLMTISDHGEMKIWDIESNRLLIREDGSSLTGIFSPDGRRLITNKGVWDTESVKPLNDFYDSDQKAVSPDGSRILSFWWGTLKTRDTESGKLLNEWEMYLSIIKSAVFSEDGRKVVTSSVGHIAGVWDSENGKLLRDFTFKGNFTGKISRNRFITVENSSLHFYNLETGTLLYSFVAVDSANYLILHPDGFYDGTEGARNVLYFVCNGEMIDLAQLKDALYVPGLLSKIVTEQPIYNKKISELKICDALPVVKTVDDTKYHYQVTPQRLGLERVDVYINEKRVLNLPVSILKNINGTYDIPLNEKELSNHFIAGTDNKVKVVGVARSEFGSELLSRGIIRTESGMKAKTTPRLFAVMIGINEYKDPSLRLNYPVKDAIDLGKVLEASTVKMLGRENVFMYTINSYVKPGTGFSTPEKEGIRKALEEIGRKARPEDVVFLFFAGHGQMQGDNGKIFTFLTAEASRLNPVGITTKELQEWLSYEGPHKMLANKTILIFDACNSGQATAELLAMARTENDEEIRRIKQVEDLKEKSGMFILAGAASNQSAYELVQYEHGLLTYCLLYVMKNNPEVLEDGKYLNLQKWFLDTEKMLKTLVAKEKLKQDATPLGTANVRIGIVDKEITDLIILKNQKPKVYCDNILNSVTSGDDLLLKAKINSSLSAISGRNEGGELLFSPQEPLDACGINISYQIQGDNVTAKLRLLKGTETLHQTSITGNKNDLDGLVKKIIKEVKEHAR